MRYDFFGYLYVLLMYVSAIIVLNLGRLYP
jgi:hypothetical protein